MVQGWDLLWHRAERVQYHITLFDVFWFWELFLLPSGVGLAPLPIYHYANAVVSRVDFGHVLSGYSLGFWYNFSVPSRPRLCTCGHVS